MFDHVIYVLCVTVVYFMLQPDSSLMVELLVYDFVLLKLCDFSYTYFCPWRQSYRFIHYITYGDFGDLDIYLHVIMAIVS